jgi:hypothetical protein
MMRCPILLLLLFHHEILLSYAPLSCLASDANPLLEVKSAPDLPALVIQGSISTDFHTTFIVRESRNFTFELAAGRWSVHLSGLPNVCDYTVVFKSDSILAKATVFQSIVDTMRRQGEPVGPNVATAQIRTGEVPCFSNGDDAAVLWFTYASHAFLASNTVPFMTPPYRCGLMGDYPQVEAFIEQRYTAQLFNEGSNVLVSKAIFYYDVTNSVPTSTRSHMNCKPTWTNAVYSLLDTTNVGSLLVPSRSRLAVYGLPDQYPDAIGSITVVATNAYLTNIAIAEAPLPGKTLFTEFRLAQSQRPVWFMYYTNRWLTPAELLTLPEYDMALRKRGEHRSMPVWMSIVFAGVCIAALSLPLIRARCVRPRRIT